MLKMQKMTKNCLVFFKFPKNLIHRKFPESFKLFGPHLKKLGDTKCPKMAQNIQQIVALTLLHSGNPGELSQIMFYFKLCYVSEFHALETVDRRLKQSSFHALLTPVIKEPYAVIALNIHLNLSF